MGKKLRNLALLGGLGAAAYMMGSKKGDSKRDLKKTGSAMLVKSLVSRS
jgi:hypothetical protein